MFSGRVQARREGFQPEAVASLRSQSELIDRKFLEELMVPGQDEHAAALQAASASRIFLRLLLLF